MGGRKGLTLKERFLSLVDKTDSCWLWKGALPSHGYGTITINKRTRRAHRVSWELHHGEIPEGLLVCHKCDPRVLAAIAAKESNFNDRARGKAGEIGMYQVLPRVHGHPGRTWRDQTKTSERLLNELVSDAGGVLQVAVRRYNGSGPKAAHYAKHVMALARSI